MTEKTRKQLLYMFKVLFTDLTHEKIVKTVAANGCRTVCARVDSYGDVRLMEQNPQKDSPYAQAARNGCQIAWLLGSSGRGFLGPVLLCKDGEIQIHDRESAKLALITGGGTS